MVFNACRNLFDKNYLLRRKNWKMWFNTQFSINWKIHLMYKPRLKENSKKQALWQFKSYQIEVRWNTGNRTTGLQGTFRGSSSLQIKLDLKEPRWLLTSIHRSLLQSSITQTDIWASDSTGYSVTGIDVRKYLSPEADRFSLRSRGVLSSFLLDKIVTDTHALNHHVPQT